MKLIIVQPYLNLMGGTERVILKIAQHYKAPIHVLEYNKKTTFPEFSELEIKVVGNEVPLSNLLPYRASQGLRYGYNFYNMKITEDYDVLNPHISPSEWIRHKNKRVMWYCHTPPREVYDLYASRMKPRSIQQKFIYSSMAKIYKLVANKMVKEIEQVATNSEVTNERIKKYFGREDCTVINPGIDCNEYENKSDSKFFLYPSRLIATKRHEYVIEAFRRFLAKSKNKNYQLILAGTLSNDPEHKAYYNKLKSLSKELKVTIKTNISDAELKKLYSNCTAVLFAAINEDYGLIPLEAMASAKPVISVNEGGPKYTIEDGKTGFLVNSPSEMAEKMALIVIEKDLAEELGRAGKSRVTRNYSWDSFFKKFDLALENARKSE